MRASFEISISIQLDALCETHLFCDNIKICPLSLRNKMLPKEARVGLEDDHFVFSTPEGIPFIPGF